jgi:hypothetical protein
MLRNFSKIARPLAFLIFLAFLGIESAGCVLRTKDGRRVALRVAQGTASQVLQEGNGELQHVERLEPKGETFMVFLRGQLP